MLRTGRQPTVVAKTARATEEVVVRKDATERVETVRDTVRRQAIDIEGDAGTKPAAGASPAGKPTSLAARHGSITLGDVAVRTDVLAVACTPTIGLASIQSASQ